MKDTDIPGDIWNEMGDHAIEWQRATEQQEEMLEDSSVPYPPQEGAK